MRIDATGIPPTLPNTNPSGAQRPQDPPRSAQEIAKERDLSTNNPAPTLAQTMIPPQAPTAPSEAPSQPPQANSRLGGNFDSSA
jgi:hypothetical protein